MTENEKLDEDEKNIKIEENEKPVNKEKDKEVNLSEKNDDDNNILYSEGELNNSYFDENADIRKSLTVSYTVILVGDSNVGKTSILKKFITGDFNNQTVSTINVEFRSKNLKIDKDLYAELKIFDTAGQEKYRSLTKQYYKNADGVILVFDLTVEDSLIKLKSWINDINENAGNVEIILVGNKADLFDRKINETEAEAFAKEKNFKYIETSAKEGTNILLLFEEIAMGINKRKQESSSVVDIKSVNTYVFRRAELNKELKQEKESKCC